MRCNKTVHRDETGRSVSDLGNAARYLHRFSNRLSSPFLSLLKQMTCGSVRRPSKESIKNRKYVRSVVFVS